MRWQRKVGIAVMKAMPLHKGHELLIELGATVMDELHIVVSGKETDQIDLEVRYNWVHEFVYDRRLNNVNVHLHTDCSPDPIEIDEHGTVLDEEFQQYWADQFVQIDRNVTHLVTSDMYGKVLAERMGLEWFAIDPLRENVEISATKIRNDPVKHFNFISDAAKPYYAKTVAIVGPESVGKSTMTKYLAKLFNGSAVNEFGRTLSVAKAHDLDTVDFIDIADGQAKLIEIATRNATSPFVFTDTEAYTTYLFSDIYLNYLDDRILNVARDQDIDLYIVLAPTVDWVDDGERVVSKQEGRQKFFDDLIEHLKADGKNYVVIDDPNFDKREERAANAVLNLKRNKKCLI